MRRIGLFGGTFDPPHVGHLMIAEWARERLRLEQVVFMPSGTPPHKRGRRVTPAAARVAMTRLAVRGNRGFAVSTLEVRRRGASYTVDTLRTLRAAERGVRVFLLVGEDSLADFPGWHRPEEILRLATLAVAPRVPGERQAALRGARGAAHAPAARVAVPARRLVRLDTPLIRLSSSGIRRRVRAGRSIRYLVPDAVAGFIARRRLYRGPR